MKKDGIEEILKAKRAPGILGSRDSFGIGNEFTDEKTGKVIDNWRTWEKEGFRQPNPKSEKVKEGIEKKRYKYKREGKPSRIKLGNIPL